MANNILITPGSASIQFSGSSANTIRLQVEPSGGIAFYGTSGTLFGITDSLSGSLMSVNDISGLPILEVFSDDKIVMGTFNRNILVVSGTQITMGTSTPTDFLTISGSTDISGTLSVTGSIGIGIATPSSRLHIYGVSAGNPSARFENASTYLLNVGLSGNTASIGSSNATPMSLVTNGINRMYFDTTGLIGIGRLNPSYALDFSGSVARFQGTSLYIQDNATTFTTILSQTSTQTLIYNNSTKDMIIGTNNSSNQLYLQTGGNVGIGVTTPGTTLHVQGAVSASSYTSSILNAVGYFGTSSYAVSASYAGTPVGFGIISSSTQFKLLTDPFSGSFTGSHIGTLTGNASTVTALQTARLINGTSFDGTSNIIITASYSTLTSVPVGIISSSTQVTALLPVGTVSSSTQASAWSVGSAATLTTARLINGTAFDGSANIIITGSYSTLSNIPVGIVSGAAQVATLLPVGTVSSSTQASAWAVGSAATLTTARLINGTSFNGSANIIITGSYTTLDSIPVGIVSSSTQASGWSVSSAATLTTARLINGTSFNGSTNIIITASYSTLTSVPVGIVSSSTQTSGWSAATLTTARLINGTSFDGSANIIITASYSTLSNIPVGIVSSSAQAVSLISGQQLNATGYSGTFTGSHIGTLTGNASTATTLQTARLINGTSFNGSANIIITASYSTLTSVPVGIVSSSGQISYTGLSSIPVGIVSSSTQASTWGVDNAAHLTTARLINGTSFDGTANIIITASYSTLTSVPVGIVSSSGQVSYTGLSNIPVGILSSSTQFNALTNTSASYATTSSWTLSASYAPGGYIPPVGIISSSTQINALSGVSASYALTSSAAYNFFVGGTFTSVLTSSFTGYVTASLNSTASFGAVKTTRFVLPVGTNMYLTT